MNTTLGPYVAIRKEEDGEEQVATAVAVDEESNGIPPEARGLMWNDTFYDSEDGVIAVFDVDYIMNYGIMSLVRNWSVMTILRVIFHVSRDDYDIINGLCCSLMLVLTAER